MITELTDMISSGSEFSSLRVLTGKALSPLARSRDEGTIRRDCPEERRERAGTYNESTVACKLTLV